MARLTTKINRLFRQNRAPLTLLTTIFVLIYLYFELQMLNILPKPKPEQLEKSSHEPTRKGLEAEGEHFTLEGKKFSIYSGEMHYFRVHPEYWDQRMSYFSAAGLNTISTYVPWNFHEPQETVYDFAGWRDLRRYIKLAQSHGLLVLLRVGPYICGEWEWGGLPPWLLTKKGMKIRSTQLDFMEGAKRWLHRLVKEIEDLQYSFGGPVVAVQVENEYGVYEQDSSYLPSLRQTLLDSGVTEMLYTCDDTNGLQEGTPLDGALMTINMQEEPHATISSLRIHQPNRPVMVAEYWTGWFDWWGEKHHTMGFPWKNKFGLDRFVGTTKDLVELDASFNLFMFHGGTNFGLWNGGIIQGGKESTYVPDTTSYDYDALIGENGDIRPKFSRFQQIMKKTLALQSLPKPQPIPERFSYGDLKIEGCKNLSGIMAASGQHVTSEHPMTMEELGSYYGYVVYETFTWGGGQQVIDLSKGHVRDRASIYIDERYVGKIEEKMKQATFVSPSSEKHTLRIVVENQGRINWVRPGDHQTLNDQRKGITDIVEINGRVLKTWKMWSLTFNETHVHSIIDSNDWSKDCKSPSLPGIFKATFTIKSAPKDTFIKPTGWKKGLIVVNGSILEDIPIKDLKRLISFQLLYLELV